MHKNKVAILLRVFDRIIDLEYNLRIIRDTWISFNYHIIVTSNGREKGFVPSPESLLLVDRFVEVSENSGHLTGNSELLLAGIEHIPSDCLFTLILEADTWVYGDEIIKKYVDKLQKNNAVYASSNWYDRFYSLATDFALIRTSYLKSNTNLLAFSSYPECHVAEFLVIDKQKYQYITENMPVHLPGYIKSFPFAPRGRFFIFPKSKMVTHHVELYQNGFKTKQRAFNVVAQRDYFTNEKVMFKGLRLLLVKAVRFFAQIIPRRSWLSNKILISNFKVA